MSLLSKLLDSKAVLKLYKLMPILGLMTIANQAFAVAPNPAATCHIVIDSKIKLQGDPRTLFPDSDVSTQPVDLPEGLLSPKGYQVSSWEMAKVLSYFPNEKSYILTVKNEKYYFMVRHNRAFDGYAKIVSLPVELPVYTHPVACSSIRDWQERFRGPESRLKGLVAHLAGRESDLTVGESFIEAESVGYIGQNISYSTQALKDFYKDLLEFSRQDWPQDYRDQIEHIKEVLKKYGLGHYCRDSASIKDFAEKQCSNALAQTAIFTSLLLDLNVTPPKPWALGIQLFQDHIRPVLYNGQDILDLVLYTTGKDSGAPIYPLKTLEYFALKKHKSEIPQQIMALFETKANTKPINQNTAKWYLLSLATNKPPAVVIPDAQIEVPLYDFSDVFAQVRFFDKKMPAVAQQNLGESLKNPSKENKDQTVAKTDLTIQCPDNSHILTDILNPHELADLDLIREKGFMTPEQAAEYGPSCPGEGLAKNVSRDELVVPATVLQQINKAAPYGQKIEAIYKYYSDSYQSSLVRLNSELASPLPLVFGKLVSENEAFTEEMAQYSNAQYYFRNRSPLWRSLYDNPDSKELLLTAIGSYFSLEQRIEADPDSFIKELNKIKFDLTKGNVWRDAIRNGFATVERLEGMSTCDCSPHADNLEKTLVTRFPKTRNAVERVKHPFGLLVRDLVLSDKFRFAVTPLKPNVEKRVNAIVAQRPVMNTQYGEDPLKIQPPQVDLGVSEAEFKNLCETSQARYVRVGATFFECKKNDSKVENSELPKEALISEDAMFFMVSSMEKGQFTPRVWIRILAGLSPHMIERGNFKQGVLTQELGETIAGSYYFLHSQNPAVAVNLREKMFFENKKFMSEEAGEYRKMSYEVQPSQNLISDKMTTRIREAGSVFKGIDDAISAHSRVVNQGFKKISPNEQNAPAWVTSNNDRRFWELSKAKLFDEFRSYSQRTIRPNYEAQTISAVSSLYGDQLQQVANNLGGVYTRGIGLFREEGQEQYSIMPSFTKEPDLNLGLLQLLHSRSRLYRYLPKYDSSKFKKEQESMKEYRRNSDLMKLIPRLNERQRQELMERLYESKGAFLKMN